MNIYVFDKELNRIGLCNKYDYLRLCTRYDRIGDFEIHVDATPYNFNLLARDHIIYRNGDEEAYYIENRQIIENDKGQETLKLTGKTLSNLLYRRIVWEQSITKGYVDMVINSLIKDNAIAPKDTKRLLNNFKVVEGLNLGNQIEYQTQYKNLIEEIEGISKANDLGFKTILDYRNSQFLFKMYKGTDRTINQSISPRCVFSKQFGNLVSYDYTDSINGYKNVALIAGAGEGIVRKKTTIGNEHIGLNRHELYVDARDVSDKETMTRIVVDPATNESKEEQFEVEIPWDRYETMLRERGKDKLKECEKIETLDAVIDITQENTKYKKDFFLGDIVTVKNKNLNLKIDTRITEVEEVYTNNGYSLYATLGENIPTILTRR